MELKRCAQCGRPRDNDNGESLCPICALRKVIAEMGSIIDKLCEP